MLDFDLDNYVDPGVFVPRPERAGLVGKLIAAAVRAEFSNEPVSTILERDFRKHASVLSVLNIKTAQGPAQSDTPSWAGVLTQDVLAAFHEQATHKTAFGLATHYDLAGFQQIVIPTRERGLNMAGGFRSEGEPIRVGGLSLGSKTLTPYSAGVIYAASDEVSERTDFDQIAMAAVIEDTRAFVDRTCFGNQPAVPGVSPAGLLNGVMPEATAAAGSMQADVRRLLVAGANFKRPCFVCHPNVAQSLAMARNANGSPAFPTMQPNRMLNGVGVVLSTAIAADLLILLDRDAFAATFRLASILATREGTIVEDDAAPGSIDTPNASVRSLFQTASRAVRVTYELDWSMLRTGSIKFIDSINLANWEA